jgi:hypothetical protein
MMCEKDVDDWFYPKNPVEKECIDLSIKIRIQNHKAGRRIGS